MGNSISDADRLRGNKKTVNSRKISVIVPHYQKQEHLYLLLKTLEPQLIDGDEIIVVDDYSPDAVNISCRQTKIISPATPRNEEYRLNHLRNMGVRTAKNDAILILDPDCIPVTKGFLNQARSIFDPSIIHGGRIDHIEEDGSLRLDGRGTESKWFPYGHNVYGGCMFFSKRRTELVGWFTEDYNGGWGADDNDFSAKCHHSGVRQRFSAELHCIHQWHPKTRPNVKRNLEMYQSKLKQYRENFNFFTPWKPAVGVMIITMMRPDLINQTMRGVARVNMPLKIRLINNGDKSTRQSSALKPWRKRWTVNVVSHEEKRPSVVRNETLKWAKENNLKYLLMLDDDMIPKPGSVENLVKILELYPELYAVSGYQEWGIPPKRQLLGGWFGEHGVTHPPMGENVNIVDCVSGGFTLVRVEPQIYFDESYETGLNDYDWSMIIRSKGWKLGNTGCAGGWHKYIWTRNGKELYRNSSEYNQLRHDRERHYRMDDKFHKKWGFRIMKPRN